MSPKYRTLFGLFLFFTAASLFAQKSQDKPTEVIILHTNDMHAKIDNMGKLAYLSDSLKRLHPYVYLVAAGDNFTGNPVVDIVGDRGYPMIDLMNECGFDVSVLGNHEFDMGQELQEKRIKQANFPFICCNIDVTGSKLSPIKPYIMLKAGNGAEIPVLGIIQTGDNGLPDSHPSRFTGLTFTNGIATAKNFGWLKEKYGMLIALTHLGTDTDRVLAREMPALDLIIGGHSHTLIASRMLVDSVLIVQAGSGLRYVGKTTLIIGNGHILSKRDTLILMDSIKRVNAKVQELIDKYNNNEELSRVVGFAETPVTGFDELGSMIADALKEQLKVDFAFTNRRGIRISALEQGNITLKNIYQLDPFQNEVMIFRMTGNEILSLIRYSYGIKNMIDLAASGMTYRVEADSTGKFISARMELENGQPVDPAREYTVAINSYAASAYRFDHKAKGTSAGLTSEEVLINYLEKVHKVNYKGIVRTFVDAASAGVQH